MPNKELQLYSCEYVMDTALQKTPFIVDKLLAPGLYVLAGAPKVGKSWLVLDLCLSVAEGQAFLGHRTEKGQVVYLALEDSLIRLQNRVYEFTDEPTDNLDFALLADNIGNGLEEQLEALKTTKPDLKLVVIDTLQKVRSSTDSGYGIDYKELTPLKILTDKMEIAILLVHHTRKSFDADPFNMISGTTGISGCVDGSFVLTETKRGSRNGKLICVGRDIENQEICVAFDRYHWVVTDSIEPYKRDMFALAVHDLMLDERSFVGSATALCELLSRKFGGQYFANRVTRDLIQHTEELASLGVKFTWRRSHGCRIIELAYDREGDGSGGALVCVEVTGTRGTPNLVPALIEPGDGSSAGAGNLPSG